MIDISSLAEKMIEQNKNSNNNQSKPQQKHTLNKNNFKFLYVIGKGGFGRVWKIQSKKTNTKYALKEMSKLKIIDKKSEKSINSEREFLSKLNHSFIVNMHYAFQDRDNLYLVMDLLNGGDLRFHISRYRKFSEEQTRFFLANIIYAIDYIHSNNVIHRDIKPENLVLDDKGYVRITDFGIAKENMPDNSSETSGTPGYMAPEVMKGRNHSFPVDFFAIGVIGYEFMIGTRPYVGKNRKEIKEQMLSKAVVINEDNIASGWSQESADFINKLLERKESKRLGCKEGAKELMRHHWLKYYPWDELKSKTLLAPFIPDPKDNFDKNYCESIDKISEETKIRYEEIYCSAHYKKIFVNFYFDTDEMKKIRKEKEEKEKEKEKNKAIKEENSINSNMNKTSSIDSNINKNKYDKFNNVKYIQQKNNINNSDGFNYNNNYMSKENPIINKIKNQVDNTNYQQINNSTNLNNLNNSIKSTNNMTNINNNSIKNIRVNKINNTNLNNISQKKSLAYKKPLSHSNSTKEIYSNNNIERYLKLKQSQLASQKKINKNQNIYRQKKNNNNNNNKFNRKNGTNININNYYTNNIFSAIYNNFIPHQNFEKKNEDNKYKKLGQRAMSVFYQKRPISKSNMEKNKNKIDNFDNNLSNKLSGYKNNK
jgi:serine/threonine protein kinase